MRIIKRKHYFQNIKIKHQLFTLVAFSMIIIILIQFIYFHVFSSVIRNQTQDYASNLLTQLEENLSIQADSIIETTNNIAYNNDTQYFMGSSDYTMRAEKIKFIQNLFAYSIIANPEISDIILVDDLGQVVRHSSGPNWEIISYIQKEYGTKQFTLNGPGEFYLINSGENSIYLYVYAFSTYRKLDATQFCYILFKNDSFQRIIENTKLPESSSFYLIDDSNRILASKDKQLIGTHVSQDILNLISSTNFQSFVKFQGKNCLINYSRIPDLSWTLISIIPQNELEQPLIPLKRFGILFGILIILILSFIYYTIIQNISRPIGELSTFLSDVDYQTLKKRLTSTGNNEIDQVVKKINTMMDDIQKLTHKIFTTQQQFYEMELSKKKAEFHALQNQINPHFLYNTLGCIRSIAFFYHAQEIVSISFSMSKILRYCIKETQNVLVRDELDCMNNYINIIQIRYDNRFTIEQDIDPSLFDLTIIKFILQPLIENSISHGLELKLGPGTLRITGKMGKQNDFFFEIYDTGMGIPPEKITQIQSLLSNPSLIPESEDSNHTSVGLYNINKRIKNIYGDTYGLELESQYGEWTKVRVLLHMIPKQ